MNIFSALILLSLCIVTWRYLHYYYEAQKLDAQLLEICCVVDKIRYSCSAESQNYYVKDLLQLFDPDTGDLK